MNELTIQVFVNHLIKIMLADKSFNPCAFCSGRCSDCCCKTNDFDDDCNFVLKRIEPLPQMPTLAQLDTIPTKPEWLTEYSLQSINELVKDWIHAATFSPCDLCDRKECVGCCFK